MIATGNLFADISAQSPDEQIATLLSSPHVRIERIVSHGHASPPGFWYDQDEAEWVLVLEGSAAVLFESEAAPRILKPGDHLHIPAHARHRVEWTAANAATIWIAVHHQ
jgi:cupin 2 domain-containing protein